MWYKPIDVARGFEPVLSEGCFSLKFVSYLLRSNEAGGPATLRTIGKQMAGVRCITEVGMGVDVYGRDATKAAKARGF